MVASSKTTPVYVEIGKKRTFAGAIEWPGWARSGADEAAALASLADYGPRYARVLQAADIAFHAPTDPSAFDVVERLAGSSSTDFGVAEAIPASDSASVSEAELRRFTALLHACWAAFDATAQAVAGKELRKGPRGGGRDLNGVIVHVLGGDGGYLTSLGGKASIPHDPANLQAALDQTRQAMLSTLAAAVQGEIPARGPRGGHRWPPRYFVRRVAWHVLDHAWELEDRAQ